MWALSIPMDRRNDGQGYIESASDPDQEYIHPIGSETLPSTFCIYI